MQRFENYTLHLTQEQYNDLAEKDPACTYIVDGVVTLTPEGASAVRTAAMVRQMRTRDRVTPTLPALIRARLWAAIALTFSSGTNSTTTATLTTAAPHGLETGDTIIAAGFTPAAYNGTYLVAVTGPTTFTYVMASDPGGPITVAGTLTFNYTAGSTVRLSTGQLIRCTTTGAPGASEPTFSAVNQMTDGAARWWFTGRYSQTPPANMPVPTVVDLAGFTALTNTVNAAIDTTKMLQIEAPNADVLSGTGQDSFTVAYLFKDSPANDNGGGANGHVAWMRTYRLRTDATVIEIPYLVSTSHDRFQIYINGHPLWEAPIGPTRLGFSRFIRITWSVAPGLPVTYQVEGPTASRKIGLSSGAVVYADRQDGVIGAILTDSYGTTAVPTWIACRNEYLGVSVLRKLGARYPLMYSLGGTGYIRAAGNRYKVSDLLANNTFPTQPDFIVVPQSFNDIGISSPAADTAAAAIVAWRRMRELFPNAFLIFGGPWPANDVAGALRIATDAALEAAFIAMADKRSGWFSPITGKVIYGDGIQVLANDGAWVTGTGYQGATNGTGNSDWATSTDFNHPSPTGQALLEARLIDVVEVLLTKAGL